MKCLLVALVLIAVDGAASTQVDIKPKNGEAVSKLAILSSSPVVYGYVSRIKHNIITNCKENGRDIAKDLEKSYEDLVNCINTTTLYTNKKLEYIQNLEECSKTAIQKAKSCLKKEHSYYPDILLKIVKSQISFVCDNYETIQNHLIPCIKTYEKQEVRTRLLNCFTDVNRTVKDASLIPPSIEVFCQKYVPSHNCFIDILENECKQFPKLKQFGENYNIAMSYPCSKNGSKSIYNM
ncbi:unnamed protein product [Phyllotreta striolata]|uniref:Uncharacterized protein n=1 Tax=Phyllotreta striolata TaxID=444603 RepID=A0A9N9U1G9_PHYSR|nr:unnamed protein product [Phyllotreta striolata]